MRRFVFLGAAVLSMLLASGCMFDSDGGDEAKKGSVSGKVSLIVTGEPVKGIKVFLVNMDTKVDTVDCTKNRAAFVDSALTDASGRYVIDGIAPGNYFVAPIFEDTTAVYRFSPAGDSLSYRFAMDGGSHTADFIAEKSDYPGTEGNILKLCVYFTEPKDYRLNTVNLQRRFWWSFIPVWTAGTFMDGGVIWKEKNGSRRYISPVDFPGYTAIIYSVENYWMFQAVFTRKDDEPGNIIRTFYIYLPFIDPPKETYWEYDFDSDTFRRL